MIARNVDVLSMLWAAVLCCSCSRAPADATRVATVKGKPSVAKAKGPEVATVLTDFSKPAGIEGWRIVNDGVMGGRSRSTIRFAAGHAVFSGVVSAENNGGFASVRAPTRSGVAAGADEFMLRVRGDGKRYQFRVRMDDRWDGPAYKQDFIAPAGAWQDVSLSLSAFEATFRGRPVPNAPRLEAGRIQQLGFLIAGKQLGPFALEVRWIKGRRATTSP
jgi:NADH dehydrogenase [ubiquinone] 1 alpha subcomplex assembly factor 1